MKRFFVAACLAIFVVTSAGASAEDFGHRTYEVFSYNVTLTKEKEPVIAAVCSVVITGAGQAYNDQWKKGGILLGTNILGWAFVLGSLEENEEGDLELPEDNETVAGLGFLIAIGSQIYSIVDAPITANRINKRHQQKTHLFQRDGERFTVGVDPITSRNRLGTMLSLRF